MNGVVGFGSESSSTLGAEDGIGAVAAIPIAQVFPAVVLLLLEGIQRCLEMKGLNVAQCRHLAGQCFANRSQSFGFQRVG